MALVPYTVSTGPINQRMVWAVVHPPVHEHSAAGITLLQEPRDPVPRRPDTDLGHTHQTPDGTFVKEPLDQGKLAPKTVLVPHGELDTRLVGGVDHSVGLFQGWRDRLFAQHVLAGPSGGDHGLGVGARGGGHANGLYPRVGQELFVVVVDVGDTEILGGLTSLSYVDVGDGDQLHSRVPHVVGQVGQASDASRPDDPDSKFALRHGTVPLCSRCSSSSLLINRLPFHHNIAPVG